MCVCVCVCVHDYGGYKKIGFHVVGICRPLSKFIVDGFYDSPLPVSTHTCLHLGTIPVDGMLGRTVGNGSSHIKLLMNTTYLLHPVRTHAHGNIYCV